MHGLFARNRRLGIPPESFFTTCFLVAFSQSQSLRTQDELIDRHPLEKKAELFQESTSACDPVSPRSTSRSLGLERPAKTRACMEVFAEPLEHVKHARMLCHNGRFINLLVALVAFRNRQISLDIALPLPRKLVLEVLEIVYFKLLGIYRCRCRVG
jgi:hypothetical protein